MEIPGAIAAEPGCRDTLNELLAFPELVQRLARFAELCQYPGGGCNKKRKPKEAALRPEHRDPVLEQRACQRPVALEEFERACDAMGDTGGQMVNRIGEPNRL